MIDLHCHLIPGIDDGSPDPKISLRQLELASSGGLKRIYLTSHYFKGHYEYERACYDRLLGDLREQAKDLELDIQSGFEIFVQADILQDIKAKSLFLGNSRYILMESELNGLPPDFYSNVYPLLRSGIKPILAHAERYVSIMRKPSEASELIEKNIYIQVNSGSLLGFYGDKVRATAIKLLEQGWVHFLGSDDHGRGDYGSYFTALQWIEENIDRRTAELLSTEYPERIASGSSIPYRYVDVIPPPSRRKQRSLWEKLFR